MATHLHVLSPVTVIRSHDQSFGSLIIFGTDTVQLIMLGGMQAAGGEILEEIEESKAFWEVYDGAVYMFQVRCRLMDAVTAHRLRLCVLKALAVFSCGSPA